MKKIHLKRKHQFLIIMMAFVVTIVTLTIVITQLILSFDVSMRKENERYLADNSNYISGNMRSIVDQTRKSLETTMMVITTASNNEERYDLMRKVAKNYSLDYVGYASEDGNLICTNAFEEKNILNEGYFIDALAGNAKITYFDRKIMFDKVISGLLFSIPVYSETSSEYIGVLIGMLNLKHLASVLDASSYGGQGITYVINNEGDIILNTNNIAYSNFFVAMQGVEFTDNYTLEAVISNIQNKVEGFATYELYQNDKYLHYHTLGIDDWTIINLVDENIISANTRELLNKLTLVGLIVMLIMPCLFLWAIFSFRMSSVHKQVAEAKSSFLANVSHEIRTPLNAIVGISEILMRENLSGVQRNYLVSIISASNGLLTIINDVLDTSKIESGKFAIVNEKYEMESLIYDLISIIAVKIDDKPIEFLVDIDVDLPRYVEGDMIRVKQILLNLIGNAVKFTKSGFIQIGIHSKELNKNELQLTMPVTDSGIGIAKKDLEKLFISFNQVDSKNNHTIEGTGLGLVISKNLAGMMGGAITVESEYGHGSTFTVKIKQGIVTPEKVINFCCIPGLKMLLLETSPILIEHYTSYFEKIGVDYETVSSISDFIDRISSGEFTHAIADAETIKRFENLKFEIGNCILIVLLKLNEQSLMESFNYVIYSPLFIFHLVSILTNKEGTTVLAQKSAINILKIESMPFVKILIVDDNDVNLQVARGLLSPYKMQVDCASSGKQALKMIEFSDYDLVFMDQMMPNMNGMQALNLIRELPDFRRRNVPVVALTANSVCDESELNDGVHFDGFLTKPIETIYLNKILVGRLRMVNANRLEQKEALENQVRKLAEDSLVEQQNPYENSILSKIISSKKIKIALENFGGIEGYSEILQAYSILIKQKITEIPPLIETDLELFVIEVHGIKGASMSLSIDDVAAAAFNLEKLGKEKNIESIKQFIIAFIDELTNTTAIIDEFLEIV